MGKDDPTIGLYGIQGVYNYGCEAIVRGTEILLREIWQDVHIKYASLRPEDDKIRLEGCNVEIVPRKLQPLLSIQRMNGIMGYNTGLYSKKLFQENLEWVNDCDAILSIGGDLYTMPPHYHDPMIKYYNPLIHFGEHLNENEKKFVIWGASIGPFKNNSKAKKAFVKHLSEVDLITSREPKTTSYLNYLKLEKNVLEITDPAFYIPFKNRTQNKKSKRVIGINLSPLSMNYSFKKEDKSEIIIQQAHMIDKLIRIFNAEILLIPHVICKFDVNDDDLRYLRAVKNELSEDIKNKVILIDNDPGFVGLKQILVNCDIVIAARMHCVINALSVGVPTIMLSYGEKSIGMAEYIYGNTKWVIPLNQVDPAHIVNLTKLILEQKKDLKEFLSKKIENIKVHNHENLSNKIKDLIKND